MDQYLNLYTLLGLVFLSFIGNLLAFLRISRLASHYNSLTKDITKKTLTAALEGIQKTLSHHERTLVVNQKELEAVKEDSRRHLQSLSLKRFNPFSDTGGDQSFFLSLLDGNKDGVMITSLHSRESTRFYVKAVKGGKGLDHPLSKEEQKLISK